MFHPLAFQHVACVHYRSAQKLLNYIHFIVGPPYLWIGILLSPQLEGLGGSPGCRKEVAFCCVQKVFWSMGSEVVYQPAQKGSGYNWKSPLSVSGRCSKLRGGMGDLQRPRCGGQVSNCSTVLAILQISLSTEFGIHLVFFLEQIPLDTEGPLWLFAVLNLSFQSVSSHVTLTRC